MKALLASIFRAMFKRKTLGKPVEKVSPQAQRTNNVVNMDRRQTDPSSPQHFRGRVQRPERREEAVLPEPSRNSYGFPQTTEPDLSNIAFAILASNNDCQPAPNFHTPYSSASSSTDNDWHRSSSSSCDPSPSYDSGSSSISSSDSGSSCDSGSSFSSGGFD